MLIYLLTDPEHHQLEEWYLGLTSSRGKFPSDIPIDMNNAIVDYIVETGRARRVFKVIAKHIEHDVFDKNTIYITGNHGAIASLVKKYLEEDEKDNTSLRRRVTQWLSTVEG